MSERATQNRERPDTPAESLAHYRIMSGIAHLLTRPSTLGAVAVAGSGAFYVGLKYRTVLGSDPQQGSGLGQGGSQGSVEQTQSYEVKPGREGGGV